MFLLCCLKRNRYLLETSLSEMVKNVKCPYFILFTNELENKFLWSTTSFDAAR